MKLHPREILSSIAAEAGERIVDELGSRVVRAIFVTGSVPRGEIAWFDSGGRIEIYSDVDISVVVSDDAAWEESRKRARQAVRDIACAGEHFEWMRTADVGVYVLSDLLAQPARPGTVDAYRVHWVLYGDAEIPKMMERISKTPIAKTEALYLLENRLIEKADLFERIRTEGRESLARYAVYAAHKTCIDAGAAALIAAGRYSSDPAVRRQALPAITGDTEGEYLLSCEELDRIEKSLRALTDLQRELGNEARTYDETWRGIESFVRVLWRRLCARTLALKEHTDWVSLVSRRCRVGDTAGNIRSFSILAKRRGFGIMRSLVMGAMNVRFSPVDALRLSGLVQCAVKDPQAGADERELDKEFVPYLDRITRIFGHDDGEVFIRARRLYREIN